MLDANNYTFLINFRSDYNGSYIVNTQLSNNGLKTLAENLKERKKRIGTHSMFINLTEQSANFQKSQPNVLPFLLIFAPN